MASIDGSKSLQISSEEGFQFQCDPCNYGGIKKDANVYCPQCEECKRMMATRNHQMVSESLMPPNSKCRNQAERQAHVLCSCGGKEITVYCKDHDEAICNDCKVLKHRSCSTVTIEEACAELKTTTTNSTKQRIQTIRENLETLKKKRTEDADVLTTRTTECRAAVEKFKKKLIDQIEKITERSLEEISKCDNEQRKNIEQHINTCSAALIKMNLDYRPFEEATTSG